MSLAQPLDALPHEGVDVLDQRTQVPATATTVMDTTGAGDLFAAGFLAGLAQGADDARCAAMGCAAAGEIISHLGARPEADLKALMAGV